MPHPRPQPDRDLVVTHAPYVRALARQLVFDGHLAEDLEQDVLLAALESAPRDPRSLRAWLAAIVRHLAAKAFRARTRRADRELARAREGGAVPTPEEILAREDLRRSLVEHVLALDEPVRSAMILRFLEELPPREIARRLGVPVETVRTRIKRGLELLRARLDREHRQGRGAWCLALVTGLKIEPPSLLAAGATVLGAGLPGVVAMSLTKKAALAVVIAALGSTALLLVNRGEPAVPRETPASAAPEPRLSRSPDAASPLPAAVEDEGGRTALAPAPTPAAEAEPTTGSVLLTVRWHDGTPAVGVGARIYSSARGDFYADAFDIWTGTGGTHLLEAMPPGKLTVALDRSGSKGCTVIAGERVELEITIERGFDIAGRVVDPAGTPVADADILLDRHGGGWNGFVVARSASDGRFEIRSVDQGLCWISARAAFYAPSAQRQLIGGAVDVEGIELRLDQAGAALDGVVLGADGEPLAGARVLAGNEKAFDQVRFDDGSSGRVAAAQHVVCDDRGRFSAAGVPLGRLEVQARGAGHSPWKGEVETIAGRTSRMTIRLLRGTSLVGRVTDRSGAPIERAEVQGNGEWGFAARTARSAADGTFALSDLPAGEFSVSAKSKGYEKTEAVLSGAPGAELEWNPVLGSGLAIRGRLLSPGIDFSTWWIRCESQDRAQSPFTASATPKADGSFEFGGCADVPHRLRIHAPGGSFFAVLQLEDVHPAAAQRDIPIDPADLLSCRVRGRIVDDTGQPLAGIEFNVAREGHNTAPILTADAEGAFDIGELPPGKYRILVRAAGYAPLHSELAELLSGETWDFGELRLQRGGTIRVQLERAAALASADVHVSAALPGTGRGFWLPVHGDEARSEVLSPGEYRVLLYGMGTPTAIAQRSARATVRAGEETRVELRVESGVPVSIEFTPADTEKIDLQVLDAAGATLWENRVGRQAKLVLPPAAAVVVATDSKGRSARAEVAARPANPESSWTIELR
ncbi:MAG TPA: sigma-70 family RNA polymerase sigma factor [Planctomycetota bacterium]|nr:sigma-70 family RNA polymerase sigma factor [Planctomycetota bacterium]